MSNLVKNISIFSFVDSAFSRLGQTVRQNRAHRQTYDALNALNERELLDIGLCRADIHSVASRISRD